MHLLRILRERSWYDRRELMDNSHIVGEWNFNRPMEQERHRRTLELIALHDPATKSVRSLEIGCSEGQFTRQLAKHCTSVTACDISPIACERASKRCTDLTNVTIRQFDLQRDTIHDQYDWVFVMDIFWYLHGRDLVAKAVDKLSRAVKPGGFLIVSDCRLPQHLRDWWWIRWFPEGADALIEFMNSCSDLRLVHRELHPADGRIVEGYMEHLIALFKATI